MATYLVLHSPRDEQDAVPERPTDLVGLARASVEIGRGPSWLQTWSPDLHDERVFSLWEAQSADEIRPVLERYGSPGVDAHPLRVHTWGPDDVLAADAETHGGNAGE